jgi:RNA polymerase sigma-70 factor (ECF subfamily)
VSIVLDITVTEITVLSALDAASLQTLPATQASPASQASPVAPLPSESISAERAFVARLKAGDDDAYEELVRTRGGQMLAVARRMLRDEDAARDAVQDAFLSAFRAIQRFDGHSQLATWLHRIVVNAALMRLRSRQRKPEQSIEPMLPRFAEDGHHAEPVLSWAESGACQLETEETQALVRAGIDELPDGYRTVLVMRDIEGLSTREAAELLGATENAVKLRLHRARQALAVVIKQRLAAPAAQRAATAPRQAAATATASSSIPGAAATPAVASTPATPTAAVAVAVADEFIAAPAAAATWTGPFATPASPLALSLGA